MAMVESYRVGAVFELKDEASPALRALYENAARLEKLFGQVTKAISGINEVRLSGFTEKLGGISEKLTAIRTKAEGMGSGITQSLQSVDTAFVETGRKIIGFSNSFDKIPEASRVAIEGVTKNLGSADAALATSTRAATELATALREAGAASRDIPRLPRSGGGGGGGGGAHPRPGQGGGGSGGHGGNTYGSHGSYIDAGILGTIGAHEVAAAVEATLHRGMEMSVVQNQMLQGGMSQSDVEKATASAWKIARADGLDVTKVMDDIKELRLPFGSTEHALNFIEPLEKMRIVLNSVQAGTGTSASDAVYKMARAGELKGLQNPGDFLSYFEGMTKAISASGGKVTPNDFAQATKYGKLSSFGLSADFYTRSLPTMIQTMGATTAGQSLQSLFGTLSGSISQKAFYKIQDLGLISDPSKIVQTKTGIQMQPGAIEGYDEFVKNPLAWAKDHLVGKLEGKFGSIDDPNNKEAILGALQGMFGNRNSAAAVAELALRSKSFDKDAGLIDEAKGLGGADYLQKHDPTAAMNNFKSAWDNLLTSLGGPAVKPATDLMNGLAGGMNRLGEFMQAHPTLAKDMEGMAAGAAAGLGAIAIIGLAAFAPGGIIAVGAAALSGALTGLAAVNWGELKDNFQKNIASISGAFTEIDAALTKFFTGLVDMIRKVPVIGGMIPGAPAVSGVPEAPVTRSDGNALRMGDEMPAGFHRTAFGSTSADNDNAVDMLAQGVFRGLKLYASNPGADAAGGGGAGGIVNASYTTYGDGGSAVSGTGPHSAPSIRYGRQHSTGSGSGAVTAFHLAGNQAKQLGDGIRLAAQHLGIDPNDLATAISYETGGTMDPWKPGPHTKWGWHHGLIQWGEPQARQYGVSARSTIGEQMAAVEHYLRDAGVKSGMGIKDVYSAINAGHVGKYGASDRPGMTVASHVFGMTHSAHRTALDRLNAAAGSVPVAGPPPQSKTVTPGRPAGKQNAPMIQARIEVPVHIGADKVAHHVIHRMVAGLEHPNSVGGPDTYGTHHGPDTALNDAA